MKWFSFGMWMGGREEWYHQGREIGREAVIQKDP
jgi:hypothetical protein